MLFTHKERTVGLLICKYPHLLIFTLIIYFYLDKYINGHSVLYNMNGIVVKTETIDDDLNILWDKKNEIGSIDEDGTCMKTSTNSYNVINIERNDDVYKTDLPVKSEKLDGHELKKAFFQSFDEVHLDKKVCSDDQISSISSFQVNESHHHCKTEYCEEGKESLCCSHCKKQFTSYVQLINHTRDGTDEKPLCCQYSFAPNPFSCTVCHQNFADKKNFNIHLMTHKEKVYYKKEVKLFSCQQCDNKFSTKSNLNRHIRIHTEEKPFSCQQCEKKFSENSKLKNHIRIHTGEKPFSWKQCDKRFSEKGTLNRHLRIHNKEKTLPVT